MNAECKSEILGLVKRFGRDIVVAGVAEVVKELEGLDTAPLPDGLRRFNEGDWRSFPGACDLPDGSSPVVGTVNILVDLEDAIDPNDSSVALNQVEETELVICGLEGDSSKVEISIMLSNSSFYHRQGTLTDALNLFQLFHGQVKPVSLTALTTTFGF